MDISIIIINFNTKELLQNCLKSLYANLDDISYEVIVVDNASIDNSLEMLKNDFPSVKIISNCENLGFARANNQAIKIAQGRHLLLLNSDTIILKDCLPKVLRFADSTPQAGIIGCRVLNQNRTLQYSCFHNPNLLTEFVFYTKTIIKGFWDPVTWWKSMSYWSHQNNREVNVVSGCFFMIKKAVVEQIGLLDENIFMYYEDSEYCKRLYKQTSYKVYYCSEAEIIHLGGGSNTNLTNTQTIINCYIAVQYYFEKQFGLLHKKCFCMLCRLFWRLERIIFYFFRFNPFVRKKFDLLTRLIREKI